MTPEIIALVMFGLLLLGLFMGHPLAFVLGGTAVLGAVIAGKPMVLGIVINRIFGDVLDNFTLIAIPLFILMARFLSDSGVTDKMFESLRLLMSNVRGGLALAVVFIYLVLASQFGSFVQPIAIMSSLPLALIGVMGGLLVGGSTLNMFSIIGFVMLMGLVVKNAILLVDNSNQHRRAGMDLYDSLIEAGGTRFRPIVMTTLAMIFGMLPLALNLHGGSGQNAPMAHAVIGGLIFGVGIWWTNTRAYYAPVEVSVALQRADGTFLSVDTTAAEGIDAETSPLRYRACFTVADAPDLADAVPYEDPTPLIAPDWFDCFDATAIGTAREVVSRRLDKMAQAGLVGHERGTVIALNRAELEELRRGPAM